MRAEAQPPRSQGMRLHVLPRQQHVQQSLLTVNRTVDTGHLFTIDYQVLMGRPMYGSADKTRNALPFIAFKYDGGTTED